MLVVAADVGEREVIRRGLELQLGPGWPSTQSAILLAIDTCGDREGALALLHARAARPKEPYEVLVVDLAAVSPPELRLIVGTARSLFAGLRVLLLGEQPEGDLSDLAAASGAHRALLRPFTIAMLATIVGAWLRDSARRS